MSRIHDALRRGRAPAGVPKPGRTAHADAVLAALGYQPDKPRTAGLKFAAILVGSLLLIVWFLAPPWREMFPSSPAPVQTEASAKSLPPGVSSDRGSRVEDRGSRTLPPPVAKPPVVIAPPVVATPPPVTTALPPAVATPPPVAKPVAPPVTTPPPLPKPAAPAVSAMTPAATATSNASASNPKPTAPALPATKPPAAVIAAAPPRSNPPPVTRPSPTASSSVAARDSKLGKPENDPRSSILDPRPAAPPADEFQLGLYYQRSGDFAQSLQHYRAALARDEMNVEAHNNLGHLYLGKGILDEAAREFQRVVAIDSKYTTAHINLSAVYFSLGRFDMAAAEARAAIAQDPRNPDAMVNLSLAQHALGQAGDAQGSLRRALEIDPRNAAAHYNLARQFEDAGEASAAIDHYNKFMLYASPEQAAYAADVRARLAVLSARIK